MAKKKTPRRIQQVRPTVKIRSDATPTKIVPRVQVGRKRVRTPGSPSGAFGSGGPAFGMNTSHGSAKDHGPRVSDADKPKKKRKKKS